jgi:hypothetical protein
MKLNDAHFDVSPWGLQAEDYREAKRLAIEVRNA